MARKRKPEHLIIASLIGLLIVLLIQPYFPFSDSLLKLMPNYVWYGIALSLFLFGFFGILIDTVSQLGVIFSGSIMLGFGSTFLYFDFSGDKIIASSAFNGLPFPNLIPTIIYVFLIGWGTLTLVFPIYKKFRKY